MLAPIRSKKYLYFLLKTNKEELNSIFNNLDDYYVPFNEPKRNKDGTIRLRNGKPEIRKLYPSTGRLKELQQKIKINILRKFDFPPHIQGGVKEKTNITNANIHKGKKYFFTTDIRNFFPSITYNDVYKMFVSLGFSADVSSLLTKLTTYRFQVPQGISTSTYITNLVSLAVDMELLELCKSQEINYTRFIDDLSFSSKKDFSSEIPEILNIIQRNKLRIHQRKTFYKIGPTLITGILVKNNSLKASKEIFSKLDNSSGLRKKSLITYIDRINNFSKKNISKKRKSKSN
jgi:RNA-directed DNA polymerase